MADQSKDKDEKSLEARVASLEDRLAQMNVTDEEMQAYQKVSALMGGGGGGVSAGCVSDCVASCLNECLIRQCTIVRACTISQCTVVRQCTIVRACTISQCTIVRQCTVECYECGGGLPGSGALGGGFGTLGG